MSASLATHSNKAGKHLYRIVADEQVTNALHKILGQVVISTGVEFYDTYCNLWRKSLVRQCELIEL